MIQQVALDPDVTDVIGSTVYFAVVKGTGNADEAFGKELGDLLDTFVAGKSFENSVSPQFDRKAKYLYLYQIVNDRGLNPAKEGILPAADGNINTANISNFALRLLVDPRYITSWGHFVDTAFDSNVLDRKVGKDGIIGAADEVVIKPMALSSDPAVENKIPHKRFLERCPAYGLGELINNFGLGKSNLNLDNSSAHQLLQKKLAGKAINWVANGLEAAVKGGRQPDYVQVVYDQYKEEELPTLDGRHIGNTIFRVDFKKNNAVPIGQHSVVFGFTSDLPPTDEPIRVEGPMPVNAPANFKPNADVEEVGFIPPAYPAVAAAANGAVGAAGAASAVGTVRRP